MANFDSRRRIFLKATAAATGSLIIGTIVDGCANALPLTAESSTASFVPNAWIEISITGRITIRVDRSEMGQGVTTSLPTLVAEELEVDPETVSIEFAPCGNKYVNPLSGIQATGASTSVLAAWDPLRTAGAAARSMMVQAAAIYWKVDGAECTASNGQVLHGPTSRCVSYGELVPIARGLAPPVSVKLKAPSQFKWIGTSVKRLDADIKVSGQAVFGLDVRLPAMAVATLARSPWIGGRLDRFDDRAVREMPGVRTVVQLRSGVAVVADTFWQSVQARQKLEVSWTRPSIAPLSTSSLPEAFRSALQNDTPRIVRRDGDPHQYLRNHKNVLRAEYDFPFLAHAAMEPMNCAAEVRAGRCDIWASTQNQGGAQQIAGEITGLPRHAIHVHTTFLGGSFGRRQEIDVIAECVELAKQVPYPVQVVWTREDDFQNDYYRPASFHAIEAQLGIDGRPVAWHHSVVAPSIFERWLPTIGSTYAPKWLPEFSRATIGRALGVVGAFTEDPNICDGAADIPYKIDNILVESVEFNPGVPVGFWRSVGHSYNAFVVETFIDELAEAAQEDPYLYRRKLLVHRPRHVRVLDEVAFRANWSNQALPGVYRGIAIHESMGTIVALVVEVTLGAERTIQRVMCVLDCGVVVNPQILKSQVQGAIAFGLSAALKEEVRVVDGCVAQGNFDSYPILTMKEMPEIDVFPVASQNSPTGIGELPTAVIGPATANALYRATGKRIHKLPIGSQIA